jgi:hypothetical protein
MRTRLFVHFGAVLVVGLFGAAVDYLGRPAERRQAARRPPSRVSI